MKTFLLFLITLIGINSTMQAQEDKYLWLEEVDGEKALEFVNKQNKETFEKLGAEKDFAAIYEQSLEIANSDERIAYPAIRGKFVYNFWKDKDHVRGIWRRSELDAYSNGKPVWETLLDIDEISEKDGEKWVYKGVDALYPDYNRFLIYLSKGGGDAVVTREFDVNKKEFIEDGFFIAESKGSAAYVDENTLIVGADFGEGTMTTSGYPRQVKLWKRGTLLKDAQLIYEGETTDVGTWGSIMRDGKETFTVISQAPTFFTSKTLIWKDNKIIKLDLPDDARPSGLLNNQFLLQLKSDWTVNGITYKNGSLISLNRKELMNGKKEIKVVIEPDEFSSISGIATTKNKLLVNLLSDVTSQLFIYSFYDGEWSNKKVSAPDFGTISIVATDEDSDDFYFEFENFTTPSTLYKADANSKYFKKHTSLPAFFDGDRYEVNQYKAKSEDGTMVPYFVVSAKGMKLDGTNPTLVYAYGGFEVSVQPFYSGFYGTAWLERGGVFVLANIRGGGEYGPKWHQDGMKEKRQNVFNDLYAVTEDLIDKNISTPKHLGVMGGSNGGLLVGVALTQRPDLYNAVVCQVPLLDMKRFNKLLAGASWMGEYGNPDLPEEWEYIKKYSPYHNLLKGTDYPEVYFGTSTRDDRVHPGHARKMVAKMNDMGLKTYYYENTEGGHAGSSTNEQSAKSNAMVFSYLLMKLR